MSCLTLVCILSHLLNLFFWYENIELAKQASFPKTVRGVIFLGHFNLKTSTLMWHQQNKTKSTVSYCLSDPLSKFDLMNTIHRAMTKVWVKVKKENLANLFPRTTFQCLVLHGPPTVLPHARPSNLPRTPLDNQHENRLLLYNLLLTLLHSLLPTHQKILYLYSLIVLNFHLSPLLYSLQGLSPD